MENPAALRAPGFPQDPPGATARDAQGRIAGALRTLGDPAGGRWTAQDCHGTLRARVGILAARWSRTRTAPCLEGAGAPRGRRPR